MRLSLRSMCLLLILLTLPGCGVVYSYLNSEDKLEKRLSIPMTKGDVEDMLGSPVTVVQREHGQILVWEYRLYSRDHWVKEIFACPFTAWLGGCLFYPAIGVGDPNYPKPFYVVLYDNQLCVWGTLEVVSASTTCKAPLEASSPARRGGT